MASNRKKRKSPPKIRTGRDIADARADAARHRQSKAKVAAEEVVENPLNPKLRIGIAFTLAASFLWAFFPTFEWLQGEWERLPDYSHGYLVAPFALVLLYLRRDKYPGLSPGLSYVGLSGVLLAVFLRYLGDAYYYPVIGAYSVVVWVFGAVWMMCGIRVVLWALPSLVFLFFMVPLPSKVSVMLSGTLQMIATDISTWILQLLGQPALSEGKTIILGDMQLEVAQACSGLRIFVGILALAYFFIFMVRRPWWQSVAIALSTLPIALAANSLRIVATGLFLSKFPGSASKELAHDVAGWVMIPLACGFFALFIWYMSKVFVPVRQIELGEVVDRKLGRAGKSAV